MVVVPELSLGGLGPSGPHCNRTCLLAELALPVCRPRGSASAGVCTTCLDSCFWALVWSFSVLQQPHRVQVPCLPWLLACVGQPITACSVAQQAHVLPWPRKRRFMPCACCMLSNLVCCRWFAALVKGWRTVVGQWLWSLSSHGVGFGPLRASL